MLITNYIQEKKALIDQRIKELVKEDQNDLLKAASYSLFPGGKRLRPILTLATVDTFNLDSIIALDVACSLEFIHTYSLIHDDLPSMDNDDLRRNKPTLHKAYPEWLAILTGDFLLTYAFEVITSSTLSDAKKAKITSVLAKRAGANGMLMGQVIDLSSIGKTIDQDTLEKMHYHKTACIIMAALEIGGIIGNANAKELEGLKNFGKYLGIAYQIQDDILDVEAKEEDLGKPVLSDKEKNKPTAVTVYGLKDAKKMVKEFYEKALLYLSALSFPPKLLKDLAFVLLQRYK